MSKNVSVFVITCFLSFQMRDLKCSFLVQNFFCKTSNTDRILMSCNVFQVFLLLEMVLKWWFTKKNVCKSEYEQFINGHFQFFIATILSKTCMWHLWMSCPEFQLFAHTQPHEKFYIQHISNRLRYSVLKYRKT